MNVPQRATVSREQPADLWMHGLLGLPGGDAGKPERRAKTHDQKSRAMPAAMGGRDLVTREEAIAILRIKRESLYAYVSRGFIRSIKRPDGMGSLYLREDIDKVRAKSAARAGSGPAAACALQWGLPVTTTRITEITDHGPRYRNALAIDLVKACYSFETVAEFLWGGELSEDPVVWRRVEPPESLRAVLAQGMALHTHPHLVQGLALLATALDIAEGSRRERIIAGGSPVVAARRLIRALTGVFGILGPTRAFVDLEDHEPIAAGLLRALGIPGGAERLEALNAALIVVADHELNSATFAARITASTSADLHCCIGAALNAHQGTLTGRACDRVEQLFEPPVSREQVLSHARRTLNAGRTVPGFNHRLYPQGDPRATVLMALAAKVGTRNLGVRRMRECIATLESELGLRPSVECALVLLARALDAPAQVADGIFALGRSAGWVAHVLEQRLAGYMIRPRAQFVDSNEASAGALPNVGLYLTTPLEPRPKNDRHPASPSGFTTEGE